MVSLLVVSDSVTLWTVARHVPLSMEFLRQKYWSGLLFPHPNPGMETASPMIGAMKSKRFFLSM